MTGRAAFDLNAAVAHVAAATAADRLALPVIGLGWATVDRERAAGDLALALPDLAPFEPAAPEQILGADCLLGRPAPIRLAILEPITEWRLAATLARQDEGPAVLWVTGEPPARVTLSTPSDGPFGRERLVLGGRLGGSHLLVVELAPGTIER
jgi:hypothetical protein